MASNGSSISPIRFEVICDFALPQSALTVLFSVPLSGSRRFPMSNRLALIACIAAIGAGARGDDEEHLRAVPFVFVGEAGDCGPGYPPRSNIVTSAWLRGMGLPDKNDA